MTPLIAPVAPEKSIFLIPNITFVALNLHTWYSNNCPLLYFDIQYKEHGQREWMLVSNNIPSNTGTLLISDINPSTWYNLLLRAVNEAGKTDAEYIFATLDAEGNTISPLVAMSEEDNEVSLPFMFSSKWIIEQLNIILPIVCGLGLLFLISIIICSIHLHKSLPSQTQNEPTLCSSNTLSENVYKNDNVPLASSLDFSSSLYKCETNSIENQSNFDYLTRPCTHQSNYFPSPYALSHLNDQEQFDNNFNKYNLRSLKRYNRKETTFHDYDTPVLLKKVD